MSTAQVSTVAQAQAQHLGIWQDAASLLPNVGREYQLSLGEGQTRAVPLQLGAQTIWLKHEDENPHGSHKDRAFAYRLSLAKQAGTQAVVLSSSGNAAISCAAYARQASIKCVLFVSPETEPGKLQALEDFTQARVLVSTRAMRMANYVAARYLIPNLRPSLDEFATIGYKTIAFELRRQLEHVDHVFTFVTSASSLVGMAMGFQELLKAKKIMKLPALHVVQSTGKDALVKASSGSLLATDAGAVRNLGVAHSAREKEALRLLRSTGGSGWSVGREQMETANQILLSKGIASSWEGQCTVAAIKQALHSGQVQGKVVGLLTGKNYPFIPDFQSHFPLVNTFVDVDAQVESYLYGV